MTRFQSVKYDTCVWIFTINSLAIPLKLCTSAILYKAPYN